MNINIKLKLFENELRALLEENVDVEVDEPLLWMVSCRFDSNSFLESKAVVCRVDHD